MEMKQLYLEVSNRYKQLACPIKATKERLHIIETSAAFPITAGELSIVFVTDSAISRIHKDFMGDPSATDVITFPADAEMNFAGEIIISVDHARSQASKYGQSVNNELSLYLIHGWLHLSGYDDRTENDCRKMRTAEIEALKILNSSSIKNNFQIVKPDYP